MVLSFGIQDFPYKDYIKSPQELGMASRGDVGTLTTDIGGLINYIQVLTEGKGNAIKGGQPLGNRYFFKTGAKCKDVITNEEKERYLYIDNVPPGMLKGLLPGLVNSITRIKPEKLFDVFSKNPDNSCAAVTLQTIDKDLRKSTDRRYLNKADIKSINACLWTNKTNPISGSSGGDCTGEPQNGVCEGCVRETYANIYDAKYDPYNTSNNCSKCCGDAPARRIYRCGDAPARCIKCGKSANNDNYNDMIVYDKYILTILMVTFFLLICLKLKKK